MENPYGCKKSQGRVTARPRISTQAAADARRCVEAEPEWAKAHYRLAAALLAAVGVAVGGEVIKRGCSSQRAQYQLLVLV